MCKDITVVELHTAVVSPSNVGIRFEGDTTTIGISQPLQYPLF